MGLLKSNKCYKFLLVAFILVDLFACNDKSTNYKPIFVDSLYSNIAFNNSNNNWEYGYGFLNFKSDSTYICHVLDDNIIGIFNYKDSNINKPLNFNGELLSFYCFDSSLTILFEDKLEKYTFDDKLNFSKETINHEIIFKDSLYLYSYIYSGIVPVNNKEFLAPFRVDNETANLLDTFAYLHLVVDTNGLKTKSKEIQHPLKYFTTFEYLKLPLTVYAKNVNTLYSTFQKTPVIYSINISTNKKDSIVLSGYDTITFDYSRQKDIGYLRKYMMRNDYNYKLFIDNNSNLYILKKCIENSLNKFELIILDKDLQLLSRSFINQSIIAEVSFIKNNRLYVKSSNNNFIIYSLSN
jgi:hypothetical protein